MTSKLTTILRQGLIRPLRVFRRREDGVAAVEFAMILPIMVFLFIGSVEFSQAITVDRRVTQIASTTADLVAREKTLTTAQLTGIFGIINHLVRPYDASRLKITVVNVKADPTNVANTTVCWSQNHANGGVNTYSPGQTYPLPTGIVEAGNSVVIAQVSYNYQPLIFNYFIESAFSLEEIFYLKPRLSSYVKYNDGNC
jgi:Flp pilus assembly protein TadG